MYMFITERHDDPEDLTIRGGSHHIPQRTRPGIYAFNVPVKYNRLYSSVYCICYSTIYNLSEDI